MRKKMLSIKTIFNSMISTMMVLLLLIGFIVVEKNTRKIGFIDNNPWFVYKDSYEDGHYFKVRFLDKFFTLDFSSLYTVTDIILENTNHISDTLKNISKNICN